MCDEKSEACYIYCQRLAVYFRGLLYVKRSQRFTISSVAAFKFSILAPVRGLCPYLLLSVCGFACDVCFRFFPTLTTAVQ